VNAAEQRRLTPALGVLCALALLLLVALALGMGRGVHWLALGSTAKLPATTAAIRRHPPPLEEFASAWQQPLFNDTRKPVLEAAGGGANVTLGDLELTGIIITPNLRMALLRDRAGHGVRVREGASLPDGGWTLHKLEDRSAVFIGNGQRTELKLQVPTQNAASANGGQPRSGSGVMRMTPVGTGARKAHERATARKNPKPEPHAEPGHAKPALQMHPARKGKQTQTDLRNQAERNAAGQREKQRRMEALKARIKARRRQQQAQNSQGH
jgi:general secretion pathway protein N